MNHSLLQTLRLLCLTVCCLNSLRAQEVLIVDAAGGGDFTALQPAIDAAKPGSVIRVRYGEYAGARISKSIRLLGDPQGSLPAVNFGAVRLLSPLHIVDLPAGSTCVVTDLGGHPSPSWRYQNYIIVEDCAGAVHLGYTFQSNLVVHRSRFVTVYNHWRGRVDVRDSELLVTRSSFFSMERPVLGTRRSQVTLVGTSVRNPDRFGTLSAYIRDQSALVYSADSGITAGMNEHTILLDRGSRSRRIMGNFLQLDFRSENSLAVRLIDPRRTVLVALAASPPTQPQSTPFNDLHLDPQSSQIFYLGEPPLSEPWTKIFQLPPDFQPSRHNTYSSFPILARPGSRLLGIPVTFQAAAITAGVPRFSLSYTLIF